MELANTNLNDFFNWDSYIYEKDINIFVFTNCVLKYPFLTQLKFDNRNRLEENIPVDASSRLINYASNNANIQLNLGEHLEQISFYKENHNYILSFETNEGLTYGNVIINDLLIIRNIKRK